MTFERPSSILYGKHRWSDELVFGDESYVRALHAEVIAVQACSTIGQAMDLAPILSLTYVPDVPQDNEELSEAELTRDSPYVVSDTGAACDGDWPPMPGLLSLKTFDRADTEAWATLDAHVASEVVTTTFNGDYLSIEMSQETGFLTAMAALGLRAVRDDAVIEDLCLP